MTRYEEHIENLLSKFDFDRVVNSTIGGFASTKEARDDARLSLIALAGQPDGTSVEPPSSNGLRATIRCDRIELSFLSGGTEAFAAEVGKMPVLTWTGDAIDVTMLAAISNAAVRTGAVIADAGQQTTIEWLLKIWNLRPGDDCEFRSSTKTEWTAGSVVENGGHRPWLVKAQSSNDSESVDIECVRLPQQTEAWNWHFHA